MSSNGTASRPLQVALAYLRGGLCVIPVLADGSKRPPFSWKAYQSRLPSERDLRQWLASGERGLAVVCGAVSGGLEVIDFDSPDQFDPWSVLVEAEAPGLVARLTLVRTPRGLHAYYRCPAPEGNQKLAQGVGTAARSSR